MPVVSASETRLRPVTPRCGDLSWPIIALTVTLLSACSGGGGGGDDDDEDPAASLQLSASPTSVTNGGTSTLTWSSQGTSSCEATGGWSGALPTSGSRATQVLVANTTFGIACQAVAGLPVTQSVTVSVALSGPAPELRLIATPTRAARGTTSTLEWSSTNATACAASGGWTGARPVSGAEATLPVTKSTNFVLTCLGPGGTIVRGTTITLAVVEFGGWGFLEVRGRPLHWGLLEVGGSPTAQSGPQRLRATLYGPVASARIQLIAEDGTVLIESPLQRLADAPVAAYEYYTDVTVPSTSFSAKVLATDTAGDNYEFNDPRIRKVSGHSLHWKPVQDGVVARSGGAMDFQLIVRNHRNAAAEINAVVLAPSQLTFTNSGPFEVTVPAQSETAIVLHASIASTVADFESIAVTAMAVNKNDPSDQNIAETEIQVEPTP